MTVTHGIKLPPLCPVTGNPQPGSSLKIHYTPLERLLDVFGLEAVIAEYAGHQEVRDIEYMVQHLARRFSDTLACEVSLVADVRLDLGDQTLLIEARAAPHS
jgi:hypothetical protein